MLEAIKNVTINHIDNTPSQNAAKVSLQRAVEQQAREQQNRKQVDEQKLKEQMDELNKALNMMDVKREFVIDRELNEVVVKIKDPEKGKVIRQIPSEEALRLAKNIKEMVGLLFDKTT